MYGGNFPKHKQSNADFVQILRIVTIEIAILTPLAVLSTLLYICRYCIAFEAMLLVSSYIMSLLSCYENLSVYQRNLCR